MNVYDTANRLAEEIRKSEEYMAFKTSKEILNLKPESLQKVKKFEELRYTVQLELMKSGNRNTEKEKELQNLYVELIEDEIVKKYFETELKFNVMLTDVNKIIGNAVKDVM